MASTGNDDRGVVLQATRQLISDQLKYARTPFAPNEQHRRRDAAELRARDWRQVVTALREHFAVQLERMGEQARAAGGCQPVECTPSRGAVEEESHGGDRVAAHEGGARRIERIREEPSSRGISLFGRREERGNRRYGKHEAAHELRVVTHEL